MKSNSVDKPNSNLLSRVFVTLLIILASAGSYSILLDLWRGKQISLFGQLLATMIVIMIVLALVYVIIQRIQMRKTETFRREKW